MKQIPLTTGNTEVDFWRLGILRRIEALEALITAKVVVPSSVTVTAGGTPVGTVTDVQTMLDGNVYQVPEVAATPGFDIEFTFSGLTLTPTHLVVRYKYEGVSTHEVDIEIYDYNASAYDKLHEFTVTLGEYRMLYLPIVATTVYTSGGAAKVRFNHVSAGNASHDIYFDFVGLVQSLLWDLP